MKPDRQRAARRGAILLALFLLPGCVGFWDVAGSMGRYAPRTEAATYAAAAHANGNGCRR